MVQVEVQCNVFQLSSCPLLLPPSLPLAVLKRGVSFMHPRLLAREGSEHKQQTLFHQSQLQVKPLHACAQLMPLPKRCFLEALLRINTKHQLCMATERYAFC